MSFLKKHLGFIVVASIYIGIWALYSRLPFFWDGTMLGSKLATWFYTQSSFSLFPPNEINPGHPPFFGLYLAGWWKLFGRNLLVSHLAMLPFVLLILLRMFQLTTFFFEGKWQSIAILAMASCGPLLGHFYQISPDVVLVALYLSAVISALHQKSTEMAIWLLFCATISTRGILVAESLSVGIWLFTWYHQKRVFNPFLLACFPPAIFGAIYYALHYQAMGWAIYNPEGEWAPLYQNVDLQGFVHNIAAFGLRLVDFGMVAFWGVLLLLTFRLGAKPFKTDKVLQLLLLLVIMPILFIAITQLPKANSVGTRYLLPGLVFLPLLVVYMIQRYFQMKQFFVWMICWVSFSGQWWTYSDKIAKNWDCTLGHIPYYQLSNNLQNYLLSQDINLQDVGSDFPLLDTPDDYNLNGITNDNYRVKDFETSQYILYSNISNGFTDAELDTLATWKPIYSTYSGGVKMVLYKNPNIQYGKVY
jgi:hypothetical protein